jgi:hypothetical protein
MTLKDKLNIVKNLMLTKSTVTNSGLAKGGVSYSADTFVVKSNALLRTSIGGRLPALR